MKPTYTFEKYVDDIIIIRNGLQRYVRKTEEYNETKLDEYEDEERLRFGMCRKIIEKIEPLIDFDSKKRRYENSIVELTQKNLVYSKFLEQKQSLDYKLLSFAKLNYCFNKYKNENYIRNDLQVLGYLTAILIKFQDIHSKENPTQINHMFSKTKLYKYIEDASKEELNIDINNYKSFSLVKLIDILYNITLDYDYEHENKTVEPALAIEHDTPGDLGHYVQDSLTKVTTH